MSSVRTFSKNFWQSLTVAAVLAAALPSGDAFAASAASDFAGIAKNLITGQLYIIPEFVSATCYVVGVVFIVIGVMKLRDHADNPGSNKMSHGLVRLATGGALVALPVVTSIILKSLSLTSSASDGQTFQGFGVKTIGG